MTKPWKTPLKHWGNTTLYLLVCHIGWFVCVISAARDMPWIGALFALPVLVYHLAIAERPSQEIKLIIASLVIAFLWESEMVRAGILTYPNGILIKDTAPYWIMALWLLFVIQLNVLYTWLKTHLLIAALAGAVAGPLSFRAGVAMGAAKFPHPMTSMLTIAVGWGLIFPLLLVLSRRWNGMLASTPR